MSTAREIAKVLREYVSDIAKITQRGDAREESHYPPLKTLLERIAQAHRKSVQVTVLPKATEAGSPDFRV